METRLPNLDFDSLIDRLDINKYNDAPELLKQYLHELKNTNQVSLVFSNIDRIAHFAKSIYKDDLSQQRLARIFHKKKAIYL